MHEKKMDLLNMYISVVMPAYNAENTITEAIQSVLDQSCSKFELIVVNDCSTDKTKKIIEEFSRKDSRVKLLNNKKNLGVSESRNRGVQEAKYEWIAFLDSDDLWDSTKLQKQLKQIMKNSDVPIFFTGSGFINENGEHYGYKLSVPDKITYKELLKQNLISCSSTVVRKDMLLKYPMHRDHEIHEDFATWLKILKNDMYAIGLNEPLLIYRISRKGKSGNKIHAAKMQWRTYQFVGLGVFDSLRNFISYFYRSLKKYRNINRSMEL